MKKKVIIISSITLVFVLAVALIILLVFNKDKDLNTEKEKFDNEIVSILTIDVNPSIEINLNKNNIVVSVVALNDDAKVVINNLNYEKENLEKFLSMLVDSLEQNNYLSDENNLILINVDSKDEKLLELVKNKTNESLEKNKVNAEIVIQQVEETSELKELAEKNNITISKAYYIQEQIKNEEGLKVEDFKDTSITEIKEKVNNYKQEQEKKKQEEQKNNSQNNNSNNNSGRTGTSNKSMQDLYAEGFMERDKLAPIFFNKYGISSSAEFGTASTRDSRCKYGYADQVYAVDNGYKHIAIMCNMTGDIYDYRKEQLIDMSRVIGEDRAWEIAVNKVLSDKGFDREEINDDSKRISFSYQNTAPSNYIYFVYFTTKTQGGYRISIDSISGKILSIY